MLKILLFILTTISLSLYANCRGCCSHHNGVTCVNEITQCRDGSPLSKICSSKGCNKCSSEQSTNKKTSSVIAYKRSYFSSWTDENRDCLNTRHELLKVRSKTPVTIKKNKSGQCLVISGKWEDYYYKETLTQSVKIDIDHLVPLKHAFVSGADKWSQSKRDQFAVDPENLVITNLVYNRQKGAKTILEWMPMDRAYACRYAGQWIHIKKKYGLKISSKEIEYKDILKCDNIERLPASY